MNTFGSLPLQYKISEMSRDMKDYIDHKLQEALAVVTNNDKDIASSLKHSMQSKYGGTWHVIVGRDFASYMTYETGHMAYFYLGQKGFLIFRTPS